MIVWKFGLSVCKLETLFFHCPPFFHSVRQRGQTVVSERMEFLAYSSLSDVGSIDRSPMTDENERTARLRLLQKMIWNMSFCTTIFADDRFDIVERQWFLCGGFQLSSSLPFKYLCHGNWPSGRWKHRLGLQASAHRTGFQSKQVCIRVWTLWAWLARCRAAFLGYAHFTVHTIGHSMWALLIKLLYIMYAHFVRPSCTAYVLWPWGTVDRKQLGRASYLWHDVEVDLSFWLVTNDQSKWRINFSVYDHGLHYNQ